VATLIDGPVAAGMHATQWDGTDARGVQVSSGVYFYRLVADQKVVSTRKLVLLK
jgi:flagellar hook assembly protein FlgD